MIVAPRPIIFRTPSALSVSIATALPIPGSAHQAIELSGVLAGDLVDDVRREMAELLLDVTRRLRPDPIGMRIVRAPHERLDAHLLDQLGADRIDLEGGPALPAPVVARLHREPEITEAIFPLEIHPVERIGDPADPALAERDPDVRVALEHGRADHGGQDVDEVHLEAGHARKERGAAGLTRLPLAHA